jgi:hypothetical protein
MSDVRSWPLWGKVLVGALVLYGGLLCGVSLTTFVQALRQHWALKADDFVLQSLMTLFLPALLIGLRRARLASGLLLAGVAIDLALLCFLSSSTGDGTAIGIVSSLVFLGSPMLGGAIVFRRLSRRPRAASDSATSIFKL